MTGLPEGTKKYPGGRIPVADAVLDDAVESIIRRRNGILTEAIWRLLPTPSGRYLSRRMLGDSLRRLQANGAIVGGVYGRPKPEGAR